MSASHRPNAPRMRDRYFGPSARIRFFQRLHFVHKQRNKINWDLSQSVDELVFDNEDEQGQDYPFAGEKGLNLADGVARDMDYASYVESLAENDDLSTLTPGTARGPGRFRRGGGGGSVAQQTNATGKSGGSFRSAYQDEFPEPGTDLTLPTSPRTRFIAGCIRERMNPRASLILRKRLGKEINISHMCIGNTIAGLLADCLGDMPHIESVNVNNNNLTDEGVASILNAVKPITTLKYLNISRNKMDDDAADALAEYVMQEGCPLESLIMQVSDVDDFEGERFVRNLMQNRSITHIDLSDNLIGRAEGLRSVIPDLVTCTEAFADMLSQDDCILQTLILSWNTIRLQSAISLSRAVRNNSSLTFLDISYNAFGKIGGEALGDALMDNNKLRHLDISNNGITPSACFVISTACVENQSLHRVIFDNNPIGEAGAQALMIVPITVGSRCKVSAEKCNVAMSDPTCWFSHSSPLGFHHLDLSKPYDRAVAYALCALVANHSTYIFVSSTYEETKGGASRDLGLFQTAVLEDRALFDARQLSIIAGLEKMKAAAANREKGIQLFHEADADGGGTIDAEELTDLLEGVGMEVSEDMIDDIMMVYDVENNGSIQLPEFLAFLRAQYREATARLEEMTEIRIMATRDRPKEKYSPPRQGWLHLAVMDGFTRKEKYSVMNTCDQDYAKNVSSSDSSLMLSFALHNTKIRLGEAISMFNSMYNDGGQRVQILAQLVVKLANPIDAKKLVMKITKGDKTQVNMLRSAMGGAFRPFLGIINGYYELDLKHEMDRIALSRLLEQSQNDTVRRMAASPLQPGQVGDTSQTGFWTCFRNEYINGKRFAVTAERFRPMPKSGRISFDFSMVGRPHIDEDLLVMTDARVVKILHNQFLIQEHDMPASMKCLAQWRKDVKRANTARGTMLPKYEYDKEKGFGIGDHCRIFYEQLPNRIVLMSEGVERESVKVDYRKNKVTKRRKRRKKDLINKKDIEAEAKDKREAEELKELLKVVGDVSRAGVRGSVRTDAEIIATVGAIPGQQDSAALVEKMVEKHNQAIKATAGAGDEEGKGEGEDEGGEGKAGEEAEEGGEEGEDDGSGSEIDMEEGDDYEDDIEYLDFGGKKLTEDMAKHRMLLASPLISDEAKAVRIVELLEDTFANTYIMARHLVLMIESFPCGKSMRTDYFGSYHVNLVTSLFTRVVDIHNFEVVMKALTAQECAQVYCRIGWLNIFNPCKPEGYWSLDFCRYEERLIAKMLIGLAVIEPGDNWQDFCFRWKHEMDPTPGWELTKSFTADATCTTKGMVQLKYYSGAGRCKDGCKPHVTFRKALFSLVLSSEFDANIDLDELFAHKHDEHEGDEEEKLEELELDREDDEKVGFHQAVRELLRGEKYLKNNPAMWNELFCPPGGCAKQKNPLELVYSSAYLDDGGDDDEEGDESRPNTAEAKGGKGKGKKK